MKLHFTGRNIELTPALKNFTEEKMERLNQRHSSITDIYITFNVEHLSHIADAKTHAYGTDIHASAKSNDMYVTIDLLVDKLITLLTKQKDKTIDQR